MGSATVPVDDFDMHPYTGPTYGSGTGASAGGFAGAVSDAALQIADGFHGFFQSDGNGGVHTEL